MRRTRMTVDIGEDTTSIAIVMLDGFSYSRSLAVGSRTMDEAITLCLRSKHNLLIGPRTAEVIRQEIGSASLLDESRSMIIRARHLTEHAPKVLTITSAEISAALAEEVAAIINAARLALEQTPPQLLADLTQRGILLKGGNTLKDLAQTLAAATDLPVRTASKQLLF